LATRSRTTRKPLIRFATTLLAVMTASTWSPVLAQDEGSTWPMLQGGPGHLGQAVGAVAPPLKQEWRAVAPGDARVGAAAVIPGLAVAVAENQVMGIDPSNGNILWTTPRGGGPLNAPAIDPAAGSGGMVTFTESSTAAKSALVGFDIASQKRAWSLPLGDIARGSPTIDGGRVYIGSRNGYVFAADVSTGELVWKTRTAASVDATPAVAGGRVFVLSESETAGHVTLASLDAATGRSRWKYEQPRPALGPAAPSVAGGVVYVGFGDGVIRAFDQGTGSLRWSRPIRAPFSYRSSTAVAEGSVYVLDDAGGIYRLDAATGASRWEFRFPSETTWSAPLVAGSTVYLGADDGTIAAVDVVSGHLVWQLTAPGAVGMLAPGPELLLAPIADGRGGLLALGVDPAGRLLDEPSPTVLDTGTAVANYAGAFVVMTVLLLLLFRFAFRTSPGPGQDGETLEVTPL
jgi:outer membrane protein assembly factor BamB